MKFNRVIILMMLLVYGALLYVDVALTMRAPQLEGNPISIFWILITGGPLNLVLQFVVISVPLCFTRTWDRIDTMFSMFLFFYIYILVMIVGHVAGIVSWVC